MERINAEPKILILHDPHKGFGHAFDLRDRSVELQNDLRKPFNSIDAEYFGHTIPLTMSANEYYLMSYMFMQGRFHPDIFVFMTHEEKLLDDNPVFESPFVTNSGMFDNATLIMSFSEPKKAFVMLDSDKDKKAEYESISFGGWGNVTDCVLDFLSRDSGKLRLASGN